MASAKHVLSTLNHDRDAAELLYVYPVVSRRAGGVSVGINLNPNNACNWRCVYCQVPNLVSGNGPPIDLTRLEDELRLMLNDVVHGDFMSERVPPEARRLNDIAFSGNGESTTSPQFAEAVTIAGRLMSEFGLLQTDTKCVLITNGSMLGKAAVQAAVAELKRANGEVWFKLDAADRTNLGLINSVRLAPDAHLARLQKAAELCPTWVQTCVFARGGRPPSDQQLSAYVAGLRSVLDNGAPLLGVLLYGLARQSHQPEAHELTALEPHELERIAGRIRQVGLTVRVHA